MPTCDLSKASGILRLGGRGRGTVVDEQSAPDLRLEDNKREFFTQPNLDTYPSHRPKNGDNLENIGRSWLDCDNLDDVEAITTQ